jgi:septum formation protein
MKRKLILASTSQPRKMLLERLQVPFDTVAPDVDETPLANETPEELVSRLAEAKARKVTQSYPDALIIGADQVGVVENKIVGKPLTLQNAQQQLHDLSGKRIRFYIGLCVLDAKQNTQQLSVETYDVQYRVLTDKMIANYLQKEQPLHCAGSCKAEGLGITLIEAFEGKDFTALIGLPLIKLTSMLNVNLLTGG